MRFSCLAPYLRFCCSVLLFLGWGCRGEAPALPEAGAAGALGYDFGRPDRVLTLPAALAEISGVAYLSADRLVAVQDEAGIGYVVNAQTGAVEAQVVLDGAGDFEDVARVGEALYLLRSDGLLVGKSPAGGAAVRLRTGLRDCDAEGLAFDPRGRRFEIICKNNIQISGKRSRVAYVYYPMGGGRLDTLFVLTEEAIDETLVQEGKRRWQERLERLLEDPVEGRGIAPSALATHPATGARFVLSSEAKALLRLSPAGALEVVEALPPVVFPQPEGMAFTPEGDLWIANEGDAAGPPTLLLFRRRAE